MFQGGCGIAHLFPKERNIEHHARNCDEYAIEAYPVPHSAEGEPETLHLSSSEIWNASCDKNCFTCQVSIAGNQGPAECGTRTVNTDNTGSSRAKWRKERSIGLGDWSEQSYARSWSWLVKRPAKRRQGRTRRPSNIQPKASFGCVHQIVNLFYPNSFMLHGSSLKHRAWSPLRLDPTLPTLGRLEFHTDSLLVITDMWNEDLRRVLRCDLFSFATEPYQHVVTSQEIAKLRRKWVHLQTTSIINEGIVHFFFL